MPPIIFSLTYDVVQSGLLLAFCGYSSRPIVCLLLALRGHGSGLTECPLWVRSRHLRAPVDAGLQPEVMAQSAANVECIEYGAGALTAGLAGIRHCFERTCQFSQACDLSADIGEMTKRQFPRVEAGHIIVISKSKKLRMSLSEKPSSRLRRMKLNRCT